MEFEAGTPDEVEALGCKVVAVVDVVVVVELLASMLSSPKSSSGSMVNINCLNCKKRRCVCEVKCCVC